MANNKIVESAEPCPFCGSRDIHYSTRSSNNLSTTVIHATCYCKQCCTYGPRILSDTIPARDYDLRKKWMDSDELKDAAIRAWNKRIYHEH